MKNACGAGWEMENGAGDPLGGVDIPDGWSPELALAVAGVLVAVESAIWARYGEEMLPLITDEEPDQGDTRWSDLDEDLPF